jgi:15-cis-phytoene synthase
MNTAIETVHVETFKNGSKTYFNSSRFFPDEVKRDVYILYGFVRKADDFVDRIPSDMSGFYRFKEKYREALAGLPSGDTIIDSFIDLIRRKDLDPEWVAAFLSSMEMDMFKSEYNDIEETLEYIYGSAEVIGLFMARLLGLPAESYYSARMLGRSMQYINFIRDINEDISLGRRYLPLTGTPLETLDQGTPLRDPEGFELFIRFHLQKYIEWQRQAEAGYRYIPRRYLVPIKTASEMYTWTADQIKRNPAVVFEKKVKPAKRRIVLHVIKNFIGL